MNIWLVVTSLLLLWHESLGSDLVASSRWLQKRQEKKRINIIKGGAITLTSSRYSHTYLLTHWLTYSLTYSLTYLLTRPLTHTHFYIFYSCSSDSLTEDVPLGLSLSHVMPVSDCLASLSVDSSYGLTLVDVQVRRNKYGNNLITFSPTDSHLLTHLLAGYNELAKPVSKSLLGLFLEQFDDKLVQILLGYYAFLLIYLIITYSFTHSHSVLLVCHQY